MCYNAQICILQSTLMQSTLFAFTRLLSVSSRSSSVVTHNTSPTSQNDLLQYYKQSQETISNWHFPNLIRITWNSVDQLQAHGPHISR